MKRFTVLLAAVLFLLPAGLVFAANSSSSAPVHKVSKKTVKKKVRIHQLTGDVSAVNLAAKTLSIKGRKGVAQFDITGKTKGLALDKLKPSQKVTVRYYLADGKKTAVSVKAPAVRKSKKKVKYAGKTKKAAAKPAPAATTEKAGKAPQRPEMTGC
ncbi:MAG: hypothetical protein M0018_02090 [Nitrospiraceae bacterium]|nr:hypothetical protein [Nitrospiraceae bacterium]